jgi:hypothetical protein
MKRTVALIFIALAVASCGVRGDPEAPKFTQGQ